MTYDTVTIINRTKSTISVQCYTDLEEIRVMRTESDHSTGTTLQRPVSFRSPRCQRFLVGENAGLPASLAQEKEVLAHVRNGSLVVRRT